MNADQVFQDKLSAPIRDLLAAFPLLLENIENEDITSYISSFSDDGTCNNCNNNHPVKMTIPSPEKKGLEACTDCTMSILQTFYQEQHEKSFIEVLCEIKKEQQKKDIKTELKNILNEKRPHISKILNGITMEHIDPKLYDDWKKHLASNKKIDIMDLLNKISKKNEEEKNSNYVNVDILLTFISGAL